MVAPRIGHKMHQQAVQCLLMRYDDLHDGYLALFGSFMHTVTGDELPGYDYDTTLRRGSQAVAKFGAYKLPQNFEEFVPWAWLGTTILIHGHCVLGGFNNAPIRRFMLTHLNQLGSGSDSMARHPLIPSMIALDITDSVIKRQMPIMNIPEVLLDPLNNELFVGTCPELFRFWYELCTISCARTTQSQQLELQGIEAEDTALVDIQRRIDAWQPSVPPLLLQELTSIEATHLQAQIRVSKQAMKLFIHRLIHPFGQEDSSAQVIAMGVMSDLDLATAMAGSPPCLLSLPFTLAAFDVPPSERGHVLNRVPIHIDGISPKVEVWTKTFLMTMWNRRDSSPGFRWMDIMHEMPDFCLNRVGGVRKGLPEYKLVQEEIDLPAS